MSREILTEAYQHFELEDRQYEYGRSDISLKNKSENHKTDRSRTEQDLDGDGLRGVDCSSLVWRGLKNAGYDVGETPFTTAKLFSGHQVSEYSRKHFDVVSAEDARRNNGTLQQGDILMFNSSHGRHVGIFKGYDANGHIEFYGSQVSTGPALVSKGTGPGEYWNGRDFQIVGALRAKPEFQVHEPLHGRDNTHVADRPAPATNHSASTQTHPGLHQGEHGPAVTKLQTELKALGYTGARNEPLHIDGDFGANTKRALETFQRDHGLKADGIAGPATLDKLREVTHETAVAKAHAPEHHAQPTAPAPKESLLQHNMLITNPAHPGHAMFDQARAGVEDINAKRGGVLSSQQINSMAAALAASARQEGLTRIDHVALSTDPQHISVFAVQDAFPMKKYSQLPTGESLAMPVAQSTRTWEQADTQAMAQAQQAQAQHRQHHHDGPSMSH